MSPFPSRGALMRAAVTVDMEHACPPYMTSYAGVVHGTPRLLALFQKEGVSATFFTTGDVARRFPETVRQIVAGGHELGCHGDSHRRFSTLDEAAAEAEIAEAAATLRAFYPVRAFRAPNPDFPNRFLPLLGKHGFAVDSSQGRHKQGSYFVRPGRDLDSGVFRIPASMAPSVLRSPWPVRNAFLLAMSDPVVPFFHPWEFVDATWWPIPWDCRVRTGEPAIAHLGETIRFLRGRGASFHRISELAESAS